MQINYDTVNDNVADGNCDYVLMMMGAVRKRVVMMLNIMVMTITMLSIMIRPAYTDNSHNDHIDNDDNSITDNSVRKIVMRILL